MAVRIKPGQTLVSTMPFRRAAGAVATIQRSTAALDAQYAGESGAVRNAAIDAIATIPSANAICGRRLQCHDFHGWQHRVQNPDQIDVEDRPGLRRVLRPTPGATGPRYRHWRSRGRAAPPPGSSP